MVRSVSTSDSVEGMHGPMPSVRDKKVQEALKNSITSTPSKEASKIKKQVQSINYSCGGKLNVYDLKVYLER